jgi:hypothetical protein
MKWKTVTPPTVGAQKRKLIRDDGSVLYGDEPQRAFSDQIAKNQGRARARTTQAYTRFAPCICDV